MHFVFPIFVLLSATYAQSQQPIHFTLARRSGAFPTSGIANLSFLTTQLEEAELRFTHTAREMKTNKVVRAAKERGQGGGEDGRLLGEVGGLGNWFTVLNIGSPAQAIELDLDMLSSNFFLYSTTSSLGTRFDEIFSSSFKNSSAHPFAYCTLPREKILLPALNLQHELTFPVCRPSRSSRDTLRASGSMLGLAPSESLNQIKSAGILEQLVETGVLSERVFSLMLLDGSEGVLSLGGTLMDIIQVANEATQAQLQKAANGAVRRAFKPQDLFPEDHITPLWHGSWRWASLQGASGWWQYLTRSVFINDIKVLKNQPTIFNLGTPFILAPPSAAAIFYAGIPGSRQVDHPYENFYVYPCLNPPKISLEMGGWLFPVMRGPRMKTVVVGNQTRLQPGGKFSLGRLERGSGYCVGAVVAMTERMGEEGLEGMWVLGEPALRGFGLGVAFDMAGEKIGFRTY